MSKYIFGPTTFLFLCLVFPNCTFGQDACQAIRGVETLILTVNGSAGSQTDPITSIQESDNVSIRFVNQGSFYSSQLYNGSINKTTVITQVSRDNQGAVHDTLVTTITEHDILPGGQPSFLSFTDDSLGHCVLYLATNFYFTLTITDVDTRLGSTTTNTRSNTDSNASDFLVFSPLSQGVLLNPSGFKTLSFEGTSPVTDNSYAGTETGNVSWSLISEGVTPVQIDTMFLSPMFAVTGQPYNASLSATGGTMPYTWFFTNSIPPGLTIDFNTGALSGTPTEPSPDLPIDFEDPGVPMGILGTDVSIEVKDATGSKDDRTFKLYISGRPIKKRLSQAEKDQFALDALKDSGIVFLNLALLAVPEFDACVPCAYTAKALVQTYSPLAVAAALHALDPSDPNFTVFATPPSIPVSLVNAGPGLSQVQADAINALAQNINSQATLRWAIYQSINRAQGASDASSSLWEQQQIQQAKQFSIQLVSLIKAEAGLRSNLNAVAGQIFTLTASQIAVLQSAIEAGGLPASSRAALLSSGMDAVSIARIVNLLKALPSSAVPIGYPSALIDPGLTTSEENSAKSLLQFVADVDGDLQVNCNDLSIVKSAFGKRRGQSGYDIRADVNGDGVVNILDLSFVARQLPAGMVCR